MKLIYILIFFTLLSGCKVKRNLSVHTEQKFEQTEQRDIHESETNIRDSSGQKITEIVSNKESDSETETTVKMTEYDTSKPVNPETGKPPVIRETESTTKTKEKGKEGISEKKNEDSHVTDQSGKSKIDNSVIQSTGEDSTNLEDSKKKVAGWPWWIILIAAAVIVGVYMCVRRGINPLHWLGK